MSAYPRSAPEAIASAPADSFWSVAYARYFRFWINLARSAGLTREEAEDMLHAVLTAILSDPARTFETLEHIRNYVARAVLNRAIEFKKYRARNGGRFFEEINEDTLAVEEPIPWTESEELRTVLRKAIAQLPAAQFEIIKLRFFSGLTFREISELVGVPLSTLKSREEGAIRRIRKILRLNGY